VVLKLWGGRKYIILWKIALCRRVMNPGRLRRRQEYNIKLCLREIDCELNSSGL
jgi:hypothetical protein